MPTRRGFLATPAVLAAALAGCGDTTQPTRVPAVAGVELTEVTYQGLDAAMKEQRGKVVMVDVWFYG